MKQHSKLKIIASIGLFIGEIETKKGFCGHYASLAAFMFRSVGIPARVVSGYLGGELSKDADYLSVFQYDAHAWTRVGSRISD